MAKIWARLTKKYRLVLYDHESLSQSRNLVIRPIGVLLLVAGVSVAVVAGTSLAIFKVPAIHEQIPGFKKPQLTKDYKQLQAKNDRLERHVEEMDSLLSALTKAAGVGHHSGGEPAVWDAPEPENNSDRDTSGNGQQDMLASHIPTRLPSESQKNRRPSEILNLVPPVDGYITMEFNTEERSHYGIDLVADESALIRAVADGVVVFSEYSNTTGYVIGIWHGKHNLISFYKHNSRLYKSVGSYVFAGEAIAVIGNTGINSSGTHLHFELWYDNNPVDPADYIVFN